MVKPSIKEHVIGMKHANRVIRIRDFKSPLVRILSLPAARFFWQHVVNSSLL